MEEINANPKQEIRANLSLLRPLLGDMTLCVAQRMVFVEVKEPRHSWKRGVLSVRTESNKRLREKETREPKPTFFRRAVWDYVLVFVKPDRTATRLTPQRKLLFMPRHAIPDHFWGVGKSYVQVDKRLQQQFLYSEANFVQKLSDIVGKDIGQQQHAQTVSQILFLDAIHNNQQLLIILP